MIEKVVVIRCPECLTREYITRESFHCFLCGAIFSTPLIREEERISLDEFLKRQGFMDDEEVTG